MQNKWRGTEYRSRDYKFARTSREAFGKQLTDDDFEQDDVTLSHFVHKGDVAVVVMCLFIAVYVMFFGWGG